MGDGAWEMTLSCEEIQTMIRELERGQTLAEYCSCCM